MGSDHRRQLSCQSRPALGSRSVLEAQRPTCACTATGDGEFFLCLLSTGSGLKANQAGTFPLSAWKSTVNPIHILVQQQSTGEHETLCVPSPAPQLEQQRTNTQIMYLHLKEFNFSFTLSIFICKAGIILSSILLAFREEAVRT